MTVTSRDQVSNFRLVGIQAEEIAQERGALWTADDQHAAAGSGPASNGPGHHLHGGPEGLVSDLHGDQTLHIGKKDDVSPCCTGNGLQ